MRFYHPHPLHVGTSYKLDSSEEHHLKHVLRKSAGKSLELVNGTGTLATGILTKDQVLVQDVQQFSPPARQATLILAQPEPKKLSLILEKGTELGISHFHIFRGDKSPPKTLGSEKLNRYENILISALKQCKRYYLPTLAWSPHLSDIPKPEGTLLFGKIGGVPWPPMQEAVRTCVIGPESGFSTTEVQFLENEWQALGISLSDNILRCETAAIVASTLLLG